METINNIELLSTMNISVVVVVFFDNHKKYYEQFKFPIELMN